ncbi:hypothetical protein JCM3775_005768 [Rhodotorula graminis]
MDPHHPPSTNAHGGGCHPPPPHLVDHVTEREERLTALVNVLGFPSLDDLEDFVFLHGAAKVVPAAQRDTLPLDDTQTQYSDTRHARRNEERKLENAQLRRDLAQARDQLEWTRAEVARERLTNAALLKDKERLLDAAEGLHRSGLVPPSSTLASRSSGAVPSSPTAALPVEVELSHCWDDIAALEADVGALEAALERANEARDECEVELRDLKDELERVQEEKARGEAAAVELAQIKERLAAVLPAVFGVDRLVSASPAPTASSAAAPTPRPGSALASSALPRAPPTPRHVPASSALSPRPNDSARSTSTSRSRTPKPSSQQALLEAEPSAPAPVDPAPVEAPSPAPPLDPPPPAAPLVTQATSASLVHPRVVAIGRPTASSSPAPPSAVVSPSSAAPSTPAALPSSSSSTPKTLSKEGIVTAKTQISLYPRLLAEYTSLRDALFVFQSSLPALDARIAALPEHATASWRLKHRSPPILPADELERFAPAPALPDDARARQDMAREGTLGELYGDVEGKERELSALVSLMRAWEKSAMRLLKRLERGATSAGASTGEGEGEGARAQAGTPVGTGQGKKRGVSAIEGELATPTATAQAVRKRRKVVKTATPGPSATPVPQSTITHAPAAKQGLPAPVAAAPAPSLAAFPLADPVARLMTPSRPVVASSPKGSDRKTPRWNLVSPNKRGRISPLKLSGSGIKAQLWRAGDAAAAPALAAADRSAVLVDDTQLLGGDDDEPAVAGPARKLWSDHGSTLEPEPDTLRTDASSQQQRVRSSSRSPRKPTPRRSSSIMPQRQDAVPAFATDADDPFLARPLQPSPNARSAAARQRAASAAASSPDSSPSRTQDKSLEMPPSAQPGSRLGDARAGLAGDDGGDVPGSVAYRRELRFFGALGTPPLLGTGSPSPSPSPRKQSAAALPSPPKLGTFQKGRRAKGKSKMRTRAGPDLVAIKHEEDDDLDLDDPPASAFNAPRASPHKKQRRATSRTPKVESGDEENEEDARYPTEQFPDGDMTDKEKKAWLARLRVKRKARWADEAEEKRIASASKRSKLEVNPERNRGEAQLFKETERRKKERQKMLAEPCQQCVEYYERAGKPVRCTHVHQGPGTVKRHLDLRADEITARNLQQVGRHRVQQRTEKEPPDYWQMGMPSSGHIKEINRRAKAQNDERRSYQEKEAQSGNGVYRWRTHADDGP